jgi:hypothetical protein
MINFKNKNLVFLHGNRAIWSFYRVIDFLDLDNHNFLYLKNERVKDGRFNHVFENHDEIEKIVEDNKFRITHLIIHWTKYQRGAYLIEDLYKQLSKKFRLPIIFVMPHVGSTILDLDNYDQAYILRSDDEWQVEDLKNGWNSSLDKLKTTWVREEKLKQLFRGFQS